MIAGELTPSLESATQKQRREVYVVEGTIVRKDGKTNERTRISGIKKKSVLMALQISIVSSSSACH